MSPPDAIGEPEWFRRIHREQAELEARYEAINQAWRDSEIPALVQQTPNWQSGWRVLHDWLKPHFIRVYGLEVWDSNIGYSPHSKTAWAKEIHILSHMYNPGGSHGPEHIAIEEEGTRAILTWWQRDAGGKQQ